ncbi:hypothetical protein V5O48_012733 [Marasmius crinis-equi]|uniref:Transmembrane protein n=1 Tax=Marasmius crinis-equi TaxID=585013 RepID=A0ABR3F1Z8_9AGAR
MELFWIADQEWMGPIGIIKTTWKSIRYRMRTSLTFILFATTSAIALITPVLMTQAYKVDNVVVMYLDEGFIVSDAISFQRMIQIETSAQLNWGLQSLESDSSLATTIDHSVSYFPRSIQNDAIPSDLLIAGNVGNATVSSLPALHLNVSCSPTDSSGLDTRDLNTSWPSFCQSHIPSFNGSTPDPGRTGGTKDFSEFSLYLCNNRTSIISVPADTVIQSRNMGYVYYTYTPLQFNITQNPRSGLIQCDSTFTAGYALVHGPNHTYSDFELTRNVLRDLPGKPKEFSLLDPLFAAFVSLGKPEIDLEYTLFRNVYSGVLYPEEATSTAVSDQLQNAVIIFASALAQLSRERNTYSARVPVPAALYTRDKPYAICAYLLLAAWGLLVGALTAWSFRRTFSNSLNSYVAAELLSRERHLLEGVPIGEADDNEMLKGARFVFPSEGTGVTETSKETKFISQDI